MPKKKDIKKEPDEELNFCQRLDGLVKGIQDRADAEIKALRELQEKELNKVTFTFEDIEEAYSRAVDRGPSRSYIGCGMRLLRTAIKQMAEAKIRG